MNISKRTCHGFIAVASVLAMAAIWTKAGMELSARLAFSALTVAMFPLVIGMLGGFKPEDYASPHSEGSQGASIARRDES